MKILIKNGHIIDPVSNVNEVCDLLIEDSKIAQLARGISAKADRIIDASGKMVMPGLVDMHVHLREPGREDKETIESGTRAALKGGVTTLLAMPNTQPAIDSPDNIRRLDRIIKATARANVFIAASITSGRLGQRLVDIAGLKKEGAVAFSDDGSSVDDEELMSEALKKSKRGKALIICHCEDISLSRYGVVNSGITSTRMGLRGISKESEYTRLARDVELAKRTKSAVHIAHVSCCESVELIARAKKKGIKVTAETAPHYFSLSEEAVLGYDTNMKVNPPLRSKDDVSRIKEGLKQGIIDVIASDHAPHTENEKDIEFERAQFGTTGLETMLAVSITELVKTGVLSWAELVRKLSFNPAKILGLDKSSSRARRCRKGTLQVGADADVIVVSADKQWLVTKEGFVSKSKNSAFLGRALQGVVEYTILAGKIAYPG